MSDVALATVVAPDRYAPAAAPVPTCAARERVLARRRLVRVISGVAAFVAIVCAVALPFAPVAVNEPTVAWPRDPAAPVSTLLNLTAYRPLQLEVGFSCAVARLVGSSGGTVVSTARPDLTAPVGLRVTSRDGRVQVRSGDATVLDEPIPAGPCTYAIVGTATGRPVELPRSQGTTAPAVPASVAGPADAVLTVARDGRQIGRLTSSATAGRRRARDLADRPSAVLGRATDRSDARRRRVRQQPDPREGALDRSDGRRVARRRLRVGLASTGRCPASRPWSACSAPGWWTPSSAARCSSGRSSRLPPMTTATTRRWPGTDGSSGRSATTTSSTTRASRPSRGITECWARWQGLVGLAPVAQRIPALVFGLLTWLLLRRFVAAALADGSGPSGGNDRSGCARRGVPGVVGSVRHGSAPGGRRRGVRGRHHGRDLHRRAAAQAAGRLRGVCPGGPRLHRPPDGVHAAGAAAGRAAVAVVGRAGARRPCAQPGTGGRRGLGRHDRPAGRVRRRRSARLPARRNDLLGHPEPGKLGDGIRTLRIPAQRPPDGQLRQAVGGPRLRRRARLVRRTRRGGKGPPRPGADRSSGSPA